MSKLTHIAEETKIALSIEAQVKVQELISDDDQIFELDTEVSRETLEGMLSPYIDSTIQKVRQALEEAHCKSSDITRLLLVGGSTRIPYVAERLRSEFGLTAELQVDPDLSVALGAAIQAGLTTGREFRQVIVDIAPHSLGIGVFGEADQDSFIENLMSTFSEKKKGKNRDAKKGPRTFAPLVRKNSKLPARFTEIFYKIDTDQERARIEVFQRESEITTNNTLIGSFFADFANSSSTNIYITFEYDLNGMIRIGVSEEGMASETKYFSMDLSKGARENSSASVLVEASHPVEQESQVSNYLIQRVEEKLKGLDDVDEDLVSVRANVTHYREALGRDDDEEAEKFEDALYQWLEAGEKTVANL